MITIYCSERLDGIAAAAIIHRHANLKKLPTTFGGYLHQDTLHEELQTLATKQKQLYFILDISFTPDHLEILDQITKNNTILYWNTHDKTSVIPPAKITDHIQTQCSAEQVQQRFLPTDIIAKQLAQLARDIEFWRNIDQTATKLADLIMAKYPPKELITTLSKGIFWSDHYEQVHKEYQINKQQAYKELLATLVIKSYAGNTFGFSIAPNTLSTADAGQKILDSHTGIDVSAVMYRNGTIAFRARNNTQLDLATIAKLFDGGGQKYAAAAKIHTLITKENFPTILYDLDKTLKAHFINTKNI